MLPDNILYILMNLLAADLRTATPILLAAIGLVYMENSGIVNIGVEGTMLIGAFTASYAAWQTGSVWGGLIIAGLICSIVGLIFAYLVVTLKTNQIVSGLAINILAIGLTTTLNRSLFGMGTSMPEIPSLGKINIPVLSKIPLIGEVLFNQMGLVYIALFLVPITHMILQKTKLGLKIRAVGEHPTAADTSGVNVFKIRYITIIFGSFLAGLGGGFLSTGILSSYGEEMVAGRGFIALAAVIFGKYTPWGALGAALLFGFGDALQIRMQAAGSNIPHQFLMMIPYILTIAALSGLVGKSNPPAASAKPYYKEGK